MTASGTIVRGTRDPEPVDPDSLPVRADSARELADDLRRRLVAPDDRTLRLTALWLMPSIAVTGILVALGDGPVGAAVAALCILVVVVWRLPHFAGYVIIAAAPWVVGFGRDQVLPLLRVNEALLAVLLLVLAARWLYYSRRVVIRLHSFDYVMLAFVAFGFLLPLVAQFVRLKPLGFDDIQYAAVFLRLALLYALVRVTLRTQAQVRTAMTLSILSAAALAVVGTADSLNFLNFAERLHRFFPNDGFIIDDGRGAATIGNPIGYGVYEAINAMIALSMFLIGERPRRLVGLAAAMCSIGVVGSGQIGPLISFAVGIFALAVVTRSFKQIIRFGIPVVLVVAVLLAPLAQRRLAGFDGPGVDSRKRDAIANSPVDEQGRALFDANPGSSWDVRLYNLEMFFLPSFDDPEHVFWGVTPQARVASPREGEEFIWIESGHLWLFWSGGVPLFITWFALIIVGLVVSRRVLRTRAGPVAAAGAAAFGALWIINIAQTFDPHMTLRGTADIIYPLLALMMAPALGKVRSNPPEVQENHPRSGVGLEDQRA